MPGKFVISVILVMLVLAGCGPDIAEPLRICPGAESAAEAVSVLQSQSHKTVSLKANGRCVAQFYVEGSDKPRRESFAVKLWFEPPARFRLQGDVVFNARGVDLGANGGEFWLAMKPKELGNSYFWGRWDGRAGLDGLKISPKILLEAFGVVEISDAGRWSLSSEGPFDVLTRREPAGLITKRMYIYGCDYRLRKIEYFADGAVAVVLQLDGYKDVCEAVAAPRVIRLVSFNGQGREDSFEITLDSVRQVNFSAKLQKALFSRPGQRGFEHIYEIVGSKSLEQGGGRQ